MEAGARESGRAESGARACDLRELRGVTGAYAAGTQFTCFTSTKVQILTLTRLPGFIDLYKQGSNDLIVLHTDAQGVQRAKVYP